MTFRVETTATAVQDADTALSWLLSKDAGKAGVLWFEALQEAVASLAEFPLRCTMAPESKLFPYEVRQLFYGRAPNVYRILFTVKEKTVYVLHIRHGRRRPLTQ